MLGVLCRRCVRVELEEQLLAVGVGLTIQRIDRSQNGSAAWVDQIDPAEVPAGVPHRHVPKVAIPTWNLEPQALQRDGPVAAALTPRGFQPKRVTQGVAGRTLPEHAGCLGETRDRRAASLAVDRAVAVSYTHLRAHETRHDLVCR